MPVKVIKEGIISRKTEGAFGYHAWGTVAKLTDGTLAAGISAGRLWHHDCFGKNYLFLSKDEGETWSCPILVNDSWMDDRDVGLCALPNNGLMLTWFTTTFELQDLMEESNRKYMTEGEFEMMEAYRKTCIPSERTKGAFFRISRDGGLTWSDIKSLPQAPPHGPSLMNDGSLMMMAKKPDAMKVYRSTDEGETWEHMGDVPMAPLCNMFNLYEAHICQTPTGRIVGVIRFEHHPKSQPKEYYPQNMFFTHSDDGGKTWTTPVYHDCHGGPGHLMVHSSGALICSYNRRDIGEKWYGPGERVMISWDDGETWSEDVEISRGPNSWDLGYPSTVELSDGSLLTTYYQKWQNPDDFNKADLKPSFLYTKWKLEK